MKKFQSQLCRAIYYARNETMDNSQGTHQTWYLLKARAIAHRHLPSTQIVLTHDLKGRLVVTIAGNSSQPKPCPAIYYTHDETIKMANYKT